MPTTRWGPIHANNHIICAIEVVSWGELGSPVEVCFLPLDHSFQANHRFTLFHVNMKPDFPNDESDLTAREQKEYLGASYSSETGYTLLESWMESVLQLKKGKKIQPLCWNWADLRPKLKMWMGDLGFEHKIMDTSRDLNTMLNYVNDRHDHYGEAVPYVHPTPGQLFIRSGVKKIDGTLPSFCKAMADVYKLMLSQRLPGYTASM